MNARGPAPQLAAHDAVVATVLEFAKREINASDIDRAGTISQALLRALADLGVMGLTIPEAFGGSGEGLPLATRVVEALARVDRSVATTVGLHLGLGTRALVRFGDAALQREWLPRLALGDTIAAFATTEPGSGSDLSRLSTRVTRREGALSVDGEKAYVTNGAFAGLLTVTARSDDTLGKGMAMLAIPTGTQGVTRLPEERKLGLKGSSTTGFVLEDVRVPETHLLGSPARGSEQLEHTLSWGRTLLSAGCCGAAATALDRAREHTALRRQFGRTLDDQPVVKAQLARAVVLLDTMQALVEATAAQSSDAELHRASVSAKIFCSEQASSIVDTALQLHGASGFMEDTGLALPWRDLRVTRIFEGANDVLLTHLGFLELRKPVRTESLPEGAQGLGRLVAQLTRDLSMRLGVRAFSRPDTLHRLGSTVVWRDAAAAACRTPRASPWLRVLLRVAATGVRTARSATHSLDDLSAVLENTP